jgi:hypothetical protein
MARGMSLEASEAEIEAERLREDPRYQLMQRILATADFTRSPQLSKFLLYICGAAFEDRAQQLSEQHIGVVVFGRETDYDSAADTIVRSHALRLRRRLEQYFQKAGKDEVLHLIIPKGSYTPLFVSAPLHLHNESDARLALVQPANPDGIASAERMGGFGIGGASTPGSASETDQLMPGRGWKDALSPHASTVRLTSLVWRYRFLTGFLILLFVALSVAFALHLRTHFQISRRHILWGRLFTDDQPTQIVLGDSGLVLFHAVTRQYVSLHDYLNNDYSKQMPFVEHVEPRFADFLLHRRYTSTVDAMTLAHLVRLPEAVPERTLVHYSRDMHIEDFSSDNVIMIGAQEAVPWVELFENHMDFAFSINHPDRHSSFINRHPQPGELAEYSSYTPATKGKVYAVIAFLPNLGTSGNVLILEGLSMAGTEAATDLAIDDKRLLPLLNSIRKKDGSLPHFEMLLESDALGDGAGPARVVAIHLHD